MSRITKSLSPFIALMTVSLLSALAPAENSRSSYIWTIVEAGLDKAYAQAVRPELIIELLRVAIRADAPRAIARVREASDRFLTRPLASAESSRHAQLAKLVGPHDLELRDLILNRAVKEAERSLNATELWTAPAIPSNRVARFPDRQRYLTQSKRLLTFYVQVWECVLQQKADWPGAIETLASVLAEADAAREFGSDALVPYLDLVRREAAALDPGLLFAAVALRATADSFATFCGNEGYRRWTNGQRDAFTGELVTYAAERSLTSRNVENIFRVYKHYDHLRAWELSGRMRSNPNDPSATKQAIQTDLVAYWAWQDPDAALEAAEQPADARSRRELISNVARVWAYKRSEQIDRAIRNLDNASQRNAIIRTAQAELAWRQAGNSPRDSALLAVTNRQRATPRQQAAGRRRGNPEEIRILESPARTDWLTDKSRLMYLRQAAWTSYSQTGGLDTLLLILSGLKDQHEIDDVLYYNAEMIASDGNIEHSIVLLNQISSPERFVMSCARAVEKLIAEPDDPLYSQLGYR